VEDKFKIVTDELLKDKTERELVQKAKDKFTFKKVGSFYFIVDSESGKKVGLHGKVFRAKGMLKLATTLYRLREAYKKQLEQEVI